MILQYVAKNSPAALMGLRGGTTKATFDGENFVLGGDIVLAVQGIPFTIKNYEMIQRLIHELGPGDFIRVKVLRAGEQLELNANKLP